MSEEKLCTIIATLEKQLKEKNTEMEELDALCGVQRGRQGVIQLQQLWQKAHSTDTWPDLGKMCKWAVDQLKGLGDGKECEYEASEKWKAKEMIRRWYLSSRVMTVYVETEGEENVIEYTATITKRFTGQPLRNLVRWMKKQGGFKYKELTREGEHHEIKER